MQKAKKAASPPSSLQKKQKTQQMHAFALPGSQSDCLMGHSIMSILYPIFVTTDTGFPVTATNQQQIPNTMIMIMT
jgi:hypothetical protein